MFQLYSHQTWACLHRFTELHCLVCTFATTGNVGISHLPDVSSISCLTTTNLKVFFTCKCRSQCTRISSPFSWKRRRKSWLTSTFLMDSGWRSCLKSIWTRSVQAIVNWPLADESELKKHSVFQEISQVVGLVVTEKWKSHSMKAFNNEGSRSGSPACLGTSESRWASKCVWTTLKPCHGWFDDSSPHWHQEDAH